MTNAARILKITMKCHLNRIDHSFYHHIPIFNYGKFSYYAYITFITVINTICAMVKCKPKCFLHFLEKNSLQLLPIHPSPPQYIINSFTYVSTRSHPSEVYTNMTLGWQHHSSWSSYGQITSLTGLVKHALHVLNLFDDI